MVRRLTKVSNIPHTLAEVVTEIRAEPGSAEIAASCAAVVAGSVAVRAAGTDRDAARRRWALARVVALAVALLTLTAQVRTAGWATGLDGTVTDWFAAHRDPVLTGLVLVVTDLGGLLGSTVVALAAALLIRRGDLHPRALAPITATIVLASTVSTLTKRILARERPPLPYRLVIQGDYAFPSGHVTTVTTLAGMALLLYTVRRPDAHRMTIAATIAGAAVLLIAATRLYLGVHWLTDVIGGALLGSTVIAAAAAVIHWSPATRAWIGLAPPEETEPPAPRQHAELGADRR